MNLTIFFADLRHNYLGYISSDSMPLGIGYMKAVLNQRFPDIEAPLFAYPKDLENSILQKKPDILFITNYTWNENISLYFAQYLKKVHPKALVIMGGPNIPIENNRKIEFVKKNPQIDLYALGEGDFFATEIVELYIKNNLNKSELFNENIHSSIYFNNREYIITDIKPRTKNIDEIPSPWLNGIMDDFFDGMLVPIIETNRGCPFSCTFCVQGTIWYSKVHHFSIDRIRDELFYIAKKIHNSFPQQKMLRIADPNFGMYNRDIDISIFMSETQALYNYPLLIDATTGKNRAENIIQSMEKVKGALIFYQAVQSMDDEVLENIQRSNIKLDSYNKLQIYIKGRGLKSSSDLILALPGESLSKHLSSLENLINSGTDKLNNFQAMLLKGSEMETSLTRNKFDFKTRFRLIPKSYGKYNDTPVFEIEEIIVSTNNLSFDDYMCARKYHIIINLFWNFTRFETLIDIIKKFGYSPWNWVESIIKTIEKYPFLYSNLIESFLSETKEELFHTKEELIQYYSTNDNFEKLKTGEKGDNLIYKYRTYGLFYFWEEICEIAFNSALELISLNTNCSKYLFELLYDLKKFTLYSFAYGKSKENILESKQSHLDYDIDNWLLDGNPITNLEYYKMDKSIEYNFELSEENLENLKDAFKIWSFDIKSFSMFIRRINNEWLKKTHLKTNSIDK